MKKVIFLFTMALFAGSSALYAQSEVDAYRYSQTDLSGSARYLGMAGSFGALGGDISAMSTNPGGLAIYRSSEVATTLGFTTTNTKTDWLGVSVKDNKTKFNFDNIAYVGYFPTSNESGIMGWNVGFSYNRAKNYNRTYRMAGANFGGAQYSLSDYVADITSRAMINGNIPYSQLQYNEDLNRAPYNNVNIPWISTLGYEAGFIQPSGTGDNFVGSYQSRLAGNLQTADLYVNERGGIDRYNFSFAANISNIVFVGATVGITDLNYHMSTFYNESLDSGDKLDLGNELKTEGTGYNFNLGIIVRPSDYLRLGVAYNTKTWYKMTDYYFGDASSTVNGVAGEVAKTPAGVFDYKLSTPDKWIFSAAAILGQYALVNVDYEISDYGRMKLAYSDGVEMDGTNGDIKQDFGVSQTFRVGAEVKVTPQFAVRAGGSWMTTPEKKALRNGDVEVATAGTIPNYVVDKGTTSYYTIGLGYRFTPQFYADVACVFKSYKENVYPFSPVGTHEGLTQGVGVIPAKLENNSTKVAFTVGYKF